MQLDLVNRTQLKMSSRQIENLIRKIQPLLKSRTKIDLNKKTLTVVLLGEAKAREINKEFRKRDYATDVLSFEGDAESWGELIFCSSVLRRQAKEHKLSVKQEFAYLLIHGILHLLGYNHEHGGRQAKEMYQLQDFLFNKVSSL